MIADSEKLEELYKNTSNKYRTYKQLINAFYEELNTKDEAISKNLILKNKVQIVPELIYNHSNKNVKIEFRIGVEQLYRIKSLTEFYECMNQNKIYRYGTNLEFVHNREAFKTEDLPLLDFILKYAEIIKYTNESTNNYEFYARNLKESVVVVSDSCMDEMFEVFLGKYIDVQNSYSKEKVLFIDKEPDIKFFIEELNEKEYKLTTNIDIYNYNVLFGKQYIYIVIENKLYKCNKLYEKTILKILEILKNNYSTEVIFRKKESSKFFCLVMPYIKSNLVIDKLSKEDKEKYIPQELFVKLFLDINKNNFIMADLKFCYKDIEFNPLGEEIPCDLARDITKENQTLEMFIKSGFMLDNKNARLVLTEEEKIYNFLSNEIIGYMQIFEVMATDDFKKREIRQPKIATIGVKIDNNLLKVDLGELNFDKEELEQILKQYKLKKKFYRLKDGSFINLERNETLDFIESMSFGNEIKYKEIEKGEISLPIYRSLYLDKILGKLSTNVTKDICYKDMVNNVKEKNIDEVIQLPKALKANLRRYQQAGYKWLKTLDEYKLGGILADDMGLGKTVQLLALILSYIENNVDYKPTLVICPSSLTLNWSNEIKKFAPDLNVLVVSGTSSERKKKITKINNYHIIISSYDSLKRDIEEYENSKCDFKYVIADEAQYIKNNNTQNFKAIKKVKSEIRYALTGTPIENSLSELWSIFDFIMPEYLFSYRKFKEVYEIPIVRDEDIYSIEKLKLLIEPFILRRVKSEVLTELPDKTITILNNEMDEEQAKIYMSYMLKARKEVEQEISTNGFEKSQMKILAILMRLRQICCHPSLFIDNYKGESSKLNQCVEIVKDAIQGGHKILLFSGYTSMFSIIEKELEKEGINFLKLTGQTKVGERIKLVDEFNENQNIKVFLISLKAGGTGLNLIGADMVIHYDPWWNISTENQATDRSYRIGQKKNVQVYKLITKKSIEEKIYELQQKKSKLIDNMLSTKQTYISRLSKDEIMELFK